MSNEKCHWPRPLINAERKQEYLVEKSKHRTALLSGEHSLLAYHFSTESPPLLLYRHQQSRAAIYFHDFLLKIQQCFRALGQLTLMNWLVRNIYGSLSTVLRYHVWLCFSFLAPYSGASLMKQSPSTHQRTSSLSTTRSLSSSSLARTTEWVNEACWEPAGKCVWANICVALYSKDSIHRLK